MRIGLDGQLRIYHDDQVVAIEYRRQDFEKTCTGYGDRLAVVLRDRDLTPDGVRLQALFKVQPKSQYAVGREFSFRVRAVYRKFTNVEDVVRRRAGALLERRAHPGLGLDRTRNRCG